jgi:PPOX class probable F420-dependent enzyme
MRTGFQHQESRRDDTTKGADVAALTEAQRAFIADNPYTAVLTTLRPDGSPHATVVWIDVDGEDVVFNTVKGRAKERHVRADPRVSVIVVNPSDAFQWVSVSGRAELEEKGGRDMIDRLSRKYIGKDYPVEWIGPGDVRITGRIHPEKVDTTGVEG